MKITIDEVLMGRVAFKDLPVEHQNNIRILVNRINLFFDNFNYPKHLKKVNDGYRRARDRPKNGSPTSWHYKGAAVDIDDDDSGVVWKYIFNNRFKLKEIGLWVEHPCWTHYSGGTWCHLQIYPPKSNKRFFIPSLSPNPNPKFWDGQYEKELDT